MCVMPIFAVDEDMVGGRVLADPEDRSPGGAGERGLVVLQTVDVFFFSSRRRHTRYWRDWSSDVCSSDLVPMRRPLETSGGVVGTAAMALIDLRTEDGITGSSYLFCPTPVVLLPVADLLRNLAPLIEGAPLAPLAIEQKLQRSFRLLGAQGLSGMAMAGVDMAAWDALAKACGVPLVRLLGGEPRKVPAYNSCGLGIIGGERAAEEALELVAPGFAAIKVRLGYPEKETDVEVVRAVRRSVGEGVVLMSDYNQSLSVVEAQRRAAALDGEGLYWIEEPTRAEDRKRVV